MDDNTLMSTAEVAEEAEVSEPEARGWAEDNAVQRVGNAFVWTPQDVDDFLGDLDEDDDEDDDAPDDSEEDDDD
jgi:hypothetical protein